SNRINMDDFRLFAIALTIQKETGGSLSTILSKLAEMVREREKFRKKVLTLTGEARTSALIIGTLPFAIVVILNFVNPDYLNFFFVDPLGQNLVWVVIVLSILSLIITKKMVKFNI